MSTAELASSGSSSVDDVVNAMRAESRLNATQAHYRMADLTLRLGDVEKQLALAQARMTLLLKSMKSDERERLLKSVTGKDYSGEQLDDVAHSFLFDAVLVPPPTVVRRSVKRSLMADARLMLTAQAVSAESAGTRDEKLARVLERAVQVLTSSGTLLQLFTPGFASGKHWAPAAGLPTTGSAAYSRHNSKYHALGYSTLVPVYIDERPVVGEALWLERKEFALDVEKHLHRHFKNDERFKGKYAGRQGGAEPAYSSTTRFYIYVAIKD